jgi:hypothetical protein
MRVLYLDLNTINFMKVRILYSLMIIIFLCSYGMHAINMTVCDITYNDKKIHMKIKFFADDLQSSLKEFCHLPMDIVNEGIGTEVEKCAQKYVGSKFLIKVNGSPLQLNYKKTYLSEDVICIEYEALCPDQSKVKTVSIKNILQFEDFPEQKNVVNLNLKSQIKTLIFENGSDDTKVIVY